MNKLKVFFIIVVIILLGVGVWFSSSKDGGAIVLNKTTDISGIITSEKENFFKDERVQKIFKENGFNVQYTRMTSDKIAVAKTVDELGGASFVFPSGVQTAEKVRSNFKQSQSYNVFYSPMIIATWKPIVDILRVNGVVKQTGEYEALDLNEFLKLAKNETRWKNLKNAEQYPVNKVVLISTSDSRYSGSAKMYLSLVSYILNDNNVVSTNEEVEKIMPSLKKLVQAQGNRETSSANMTTDYMSIGRGKIPMMFTYESEFLGNAFQNKNLMKPDMQLIYPTPTVFTKHVMVVLNSKAQPLVDLLKTNPELKKIALENGFRFDGDVGLVEKAKAVGINIPKELVDVIDPPSYDVLDYMTENVEKK